MLLTCHWPNRNPLHHALHMMPTTIPVLTKMQPPIQDLHSSSTWSLLVARCVCYCYLLSKRGLHSGVTERRRARGSRGSRRCSAQAGLTISFIACVKCKHLLRLRGHTRGRRVGTRRCVGLGSEGWSNRPLHQLHWHTILTGFGGGWGV